MRSALPFLCLCASVAAVAEGPLLDNMDAATFSCRDPKLAIRSVDGKLGKALQFDFAEKAQNVFAIGKLRGTPEWDKAAGFSFWARGDGSANVGALQFVWGDDYKQRYDFAFPLKSAEWTKVVVPWRDLVPVLPGPAIDAQHGNAPSKLGQLWIGKWWYWREYPAHSFAIDEIRLEPTLPEVAAEVTAAGQGLVRVTAKLRAGKPITIVTMGDSLTDFAHWANKPVNWPTLLKEALQKEFKSEVTLVNPAIGGTQLGQNLVMMPRWLGSTPEPDLVTVCFGYNDWDAGMRGERFFAAQKDAVERIRRATHGRADVLLITTNPALERWTTMSELADAVRRATRETNAGLADTEAAFHAVAEDQRAQLYCRDKTHLGPAGHELLAKTVAKALRGE
jgi:lysophospholipase L1-like esterase